MGGSFVNNSNVNQKSVGEGNTVIKKSREGERPLLEIDVNLKHGVGKRRKTKNYNGCSERS